MNSVYSHQFVQYEEITVYSEYVKHTLHHTPVLPGTVVVALYVASIDELLSDNAVGKLYNHKQASLRGQVNYSTGLLKFKIDKEIVKKVKAVVSYEYSIEAKNGDNLPQTP